jgi:YHS domain-containing protein
MNRKTLLLLIAVMFVFGLSKISYAMSCHESAGHDANMQTAQMDSSQQSTMVHSKSTSQEAVNVGNKICPVTGEKIDEKIKATYEYKGKIYNFCCAACIEEFKKNPDKYIQIVNEEMKNN